MILNASDAQGVVLVFKVNYSATREQWQINCPLKSITWKVTETKWHYPYNLQHGISAYSNTMSINQVIKYVRASSRIPFEEKTTVLTINNDYQFKYLVKVKHVYVLIQNMFD